MENSAVLSNNIKLVKYLSIWHELNGIVELCLLNHSIQEASLLANRLLLDCN